MKLQPNIPVMTMNVSGLYSKSKADFQNRLQTKQNTTKNTICITDRPKQNYWSFRGDN